MKGDLISVITYVITYFSIQSMLDKSKRYEKCFLTSILSGTLLCLITQPFISSCDNTRKGLKTFVQYETKSESGKK